MPKFRTHYDNLKVSRDAPIEVIQAAYRSLARKYHPDRNGSNSPKSEAIMKIINASYEVLSDPVKRAEHDRWIDAQLNHGPIHWGSGQGGRPERSGGRAEGHRQTSRRNARPPITFTTIMLAVAYFGVALFLIRIPNTRVMGIGMLVAGWIYFQMRGR